MTGNARRRRFGAGFICCLGISLLAGCSEKKTVEYGIEGSTQSVPAKGAAGGNVEQFDKDWEFEEFRGGWESVTKDGEKVELRLGKFTDNASDMEVVLPDAEEMFVVEVEEPEFDADFKRRVAKAVFSGGKIYNADNFNAEQYLGEYEGISYVLSFQDDNPDKWNCRSKEISMMPKDIYQVCPQEVSEVEDLCMEDEVDFGLRDENRCDISEQKARETAERFVNGLGLSYPVCSAVRPLAWRTGRKTADVHEDYLAYGYKVFCDIGVDGLSFTEMGAQESYGNMEQKKDSEEPKYNMKARLEVYVTEKGVIGMKAHNPVEITGISKGVKFLPLENVLEMMREQTMKNPELFRFYQPANIESGSIFVNYGEAALIYFRVRDKDNDGHYSYVPAWRFAQSVFGGRMDNSVIINAIDGSVINFYEEA